MLVVRLLVLVLLIMLMMIFEFLVKCLVKVWIVVIKLKEFRMDGWMFRVIFLILCRVLLSWVLIMVLICWCLGLLSCLFFK